jgi:hypothetical protein
MFDRSPRSVELTEGAPLNALTYELVEVSPNAGWVRARFGTGIKNVQS